ncbi:MAG TPA: HNH endonuclease signature motif containing protein [Streptosporangiaceae bacterium]
MIACGATASVMVHDPGSGEVLSLGRRSRRATAAIRRAVRERDGYRCTFPGCDSRHTDLHHIVWWSRGGQTSAANLQLLCKAHHAIVHDKGYIVTRRPGGYTFTRPDGLILAAPPGLPAPAGGISEVHDAAITPDTISKPVYGERLDLHLAIWIALNNKRNRQPEHTAQAA